MNNTANRPQKPPVPKFNVIGLGTDTPDSVEPEPETASLGGIGVQAVPEPSIEMLSQKDSKVGKKLNALIDLLDHQLTDSAVLTHKDQIQKVAIDLMTKLDGDDLKSKKASSVTVAAIIHATRILSLPVTMKQILEEIDCCEKQMKKVLSLFQSINPPTRTDQVEAFLKADCLTLGFNDQFRMVCEFALDFLKQKGAILGEHDHVVAATIIKQVNDILLGDKGYSIASISEKCSCSEYAIKTLLRKTHLLQNELFQALHRNE